jgi:hypothetical protein
MSKFSLLMMLSGAMGFTSCASVKVPTTLQGSWKLVGVECKDHQPGKLAKDDKRGIDSKTFDEILVISGGRVEQHFIERKSTKQPDLYCETILSYQWNVSAGIVHSSGSTFESREGKNGYQCYEPFRTSQQTMPDVPYRIDGDRLIMSHQDIRLKDKDGHTQYECKTGSDVDHIYRKQ